MATYNYTVTASGNSYYLWNGHGLVDARNPDLFFRAGDAINITNASGGHPMRITNNASPSVGQINESNGAINISTAGEGAFTYVCTSHAAMTGQITVSAAYANEGPEDGYGTGPLIGRDAGPLSMNEIRTKINEIITKGGVGGTPSTGGGGTPSTGGGSISVSQNAPSSPSDGDLWWDEDTASLYVYFEDRDAWIQTNGAVGGGSGIDFYSGTFHGEDQSADDHVIIIPVPSNGKCGGVLELSDYATNSNQDEGGMLSWNFDATTGEIKMQQCWSGGNSTYLKSNSVTATLTNTYQSIDISMPYQLVAWEARYLDGSLYLSSDAHIGVWQATVSSDGGGASGGGGTNLLAGGGGGGGSYGTSAIDAAADQFFYSDAGHTTGINLTNATDGARFYNKDKFILVHLVYSASSNQSATLDVTYYPPGSSTGYIVGATRKGGGSGHAYQQNITFAMAPGSSCQVDNTSFVQRAATVLLADSGAGPRAYVVFDGRSANLTGSITSSFNVSSINDVSTGVYEVNLTSTINNPILVSSWQGEYRAAYSDVTSSAIKTIALPYDTTTGLGATSTNKIYVGVNQPQNGVPQDRPIHLLVF